MNVRVTLTKTVTENFGIGRSHSTTITYNVHTDITHVSTVAHVASEKGYTVAYVGTADWHGEEEEGNPS
jgi:hypothetical protein